MVLYWHHYLINIKKFSLKDPFFPRTRVEQVSNTDYAFQANGVEPIYWQDAESMRVILKDVCKTAGVKYFSPHKFRHAAIRLSMDKCKTAEQMKAVSQNLGHDRLSTTLLTYGRLAPEDVGKVIGNLSFNKEDLENDRKLDEILKIIQK